MLNTSRLIALTLLCASLTACEGPPPEPPLAGATIGGAFTLTNAAGTRMSDTDFRGQYRLVYFGYSFCPDVCPVDLNYMSLGLREFERQSPDRAARITPIFISVDPARDTPEVLVRFARQFHPRLVALTGSEAEIADVARKYAVQYSRVPGSNAESYLVAHTQLVYLMDPDGRPLALIPHDEPGTEANEGAPALIAAELDRWVR